jgi:hypothetical protein
VACGGGVWWGRVAVACGAACLTLSVSSMARCLRARLAALGSLCPCPASPSVSNHCSLLTDIATARLQMGRCSFRACVSLLPFAPELGREDVCHFRGAGVLAQRGYFGAEFVPGLLGCRPDGCVSFKWDPDSDDDLVLMRPRLARPGEFLGDEIAGGCLWKMLNRNVPWLSDGDEVRRWMYGPVLSRNNPDALRLRAHLATSLPQGHTPSAADVGPPSLDHPGEEVEDELAFGEHESNSVGSGESEREVGSGNGSENEDDALDLRAGLGSGN